MSEVKLFLDTNIYLQFAHVRDVKFRDFVDAERISILIPNITLAELDAKKDDDRHRDRARAILRDIENWQQTGGALRDDVTIGLCTLLPDIDYRAKGLAKHRPDDEFIASVLTYITEHPDQRACVIADDGKVRIDCRRLGIEVVAMPEKYRSKPRISPCERELREAKAKLQRWEAASPKLNLQFASGKSQRIEYQVNPVGTLTREELDRITKAAEQSVESFRRSTREEKQYDPTGMFSHLSSRYSAEEINRFERECSGYPRAMRAYRNLASEFAKMRSYSLVFELELSNHGTKPAQDVGIELTFPEGISGGCTIDELAQLPARPELPTPPRTNEEISLYRIQELSGREREIEAVPYYESKRVEQDLVVSAEFGDLKHGHSVSLPNMAILLAPGAVRSFNCQYKLTVGNMPDATTGELHFIHK